MPITIGGSQERTNHYAIKKSVAEKILNAHIKKHGLIDFHQYDWVPGKCDPILRDDKRRERRGVLNRIERIVNRFSTGQYYMLEQFVCWARPEVIRTMRPMDDGDLEAFLLEYWEYVTGDFLK